MEREEIKLNDRIAVRVDKKTKDELMKKVKAENKNLSDVVLEWVRNYLSQPEEQSPDLVKIQADVEFLKRQVSYLEGELVKKSVA
jgi:polyhydroxyalkanoate synthesis regulator phasin